MSKKARDRDDAFAQTLDLLRAEVKKKEAEISQHFPTFTKHGVDHVETVRRAAETLSGSLGLKPVEKFCLDAACLSHDLGMAHGKAQEAYAIENREGIRRWHAQLSGQYIHNELSKNCFHDMEPERDAIARIVEGHGRWDWDDSFFDDDNNIRIRLLTALLSLADALDISSARRVPEDIGSAAALMDYAFLTETAKQNPAIARIPELADLSRVHWLRHYYSVQPGLTMDPSGRTASIRLKARVGLQDRTPGSHDYDRHEPLIKELIQSELMELLEFDGFKEAVDSHLTVKLVPAKGNWPSFVEVQEDPAKMLFPGELVEAAFAARMVRPRTLPLTQKSYYSTRIEGFVGPADVQVSISWLPSAARTDSSAASTAVKQADKTIRGLAERTWDFVLWPISPFVSLLHAEALINPEDVEERFNRLWDISEKIRSGKYKAYYIALDQPLSPQPLTATSHVAKFAFYTGIPLPLTGGEFLGGTLELCSVAQRSAFQTTCEAAARSLNITGDRASLPKLLKSKASKEEAFAVTVRSLQQIIKALRREFGTTPIPDSLVTFFGDYESRIRSSQGISPA